MGRAFEVCNYPSEDMGKASSEDCAASRGETDCKRARTYFPAGRYATARRKKKYGLAFAPPPFQRRKLPIKTQKRRKRLPVLVPQVSPNFRGVTEPSTWMDSRTGDRIWRQRILKLASFLIGRVQSCKLTLLCQETKSFTPYGWRPDPAGAEPICGKS